MSLVHLGDYTTGETVMLPFNTFTSDDPSISCTVTDLALGDIEVHKDGNTTQRSSDSGYGVNIDFDGVTGNHLITLQLSDNSDAGFYANGSRYQVRLEGMTVDGGTPLNVWIGTFSIGVMAAALATYDPPTKAELDVVGASVLAILADTNELQGDGIATLIGALPTASENRIEMDATSTALATYAPFVGASMPELVDDIWDEDVDTSHQTAGTAGKKLDDAGAAADPWSTAIPGAYGVGTAGKILGDNLIDVGATVTAIFADTDELQSDDVPTLIGALPVDVRMEMDVNSTALATYDPPTKAELDVVGASVLLVLADTDELQSDDIPADIAGVDGKIDLVNASMTAVLVDSSELQGDWVNGGRLDLLLDAIPTTAMRGTDSAATETKQDIVGASVVVSDKVTDAIKVVTDAFTAAAAAKLALSGGTIVTGTAATGTLSTTEMTTDLTISVNDQYNGRILIFLSDTTTAALQGQATDITDTVTTNGKLTFTALTTAPVNGDSFVIV